MKMYHPNGHSVVECHPTQVENMKRSGWTTEKPKPKTEPKKTTEEKE